MEKFPLEKSPQYTQRLEQARSERSRESAERFRMETLLDNAALVRLFVERLEADPTTSKEEFIELAQNSGKVVHPKVVNEFIKELTQTRDFIERSVEDLQRHAKSRSVGLGKQLYRWVLPYNKQDNFFPRGRITINRNYPLALIAYIQNKRDFETIDARKNVGGFYKEFQFYRTRPPEYIGTIFREFPLIAVHGTDPEKHQSSRSHPILRHEKGHAENEALRDALRKADRKLVWGKLDYPWLAIEKLRSGQVETGDIRNLEDYKVVLRYALAHAKDEILAEYKSQYGLFAHHTQNLKQKGGLYDYFAQMGIESDSPIYAMLWEDYEREIDGATQVVQTITQSYWLAYSMLTRKIELFRWVLAQIPLEQWSRQLKNSLFSKEAEKLRQAKQVINEALNTLESDELYEIIEGSNDSHHLHSQKARDISEFVQDVIDNEEKPLFEILEKSPFKKAENQKG
jgi:hypothetical protein